MKRLGKISILADVRKQITVADYSPQNLIDGVKIIELTNHIAEDGDLSEIIRINGNGTLKELSDFKLAQIIRVKHNPNTVKAWHLHYSQDEVWYVAPSEHLFVGLWDIREKSKTSKLTMRVVLGGSLSQLLYIPRGVAHGSANFIQKSVDLYSFLNRPFDLKKPDEMRLPWDILGKEFWQPLKD